jgi:hypothetical protein
VENLTYTGCQKREEKTKKRLLKRNQQNAPMPRPAKKIFIFIPISFVDPTLPRNKHAHKKIIHLQYLHIIAPGPAATQPHSVTPS